MAQQSGQTSRCETYKQQLGHGTQQSLLIIAHDTARTYTLRGKTHNGQAIFQLYFKSPRAVHIMHSESRTVHYSVMSQQFTFNYTHTTTHFSYSHVTQCTINVHQFA